MIGHLRRVPNLWLYFALDQILPISFTINLFFLAVLLTPSESSLRRTSTSWSAPSPMKQILLLGVYLLALSIAPSIKDTPTLIPVVLLTRLLLLCPYLAFRPRATPSSGSTNRSSEASRNLHDYGRIGQAYKPAVLTGVIGYLVLQLQHTAVGSSVALPLSKRVIIAINNDSAVSALGYDHLIGILSLVVWYAARSNVEV